MSSDFKVNTKERKVYSLLFSFVKIFFFINYYTYVVNKIK